MEVGNNFVSIVSLGCFNPAILTPKFFKEYCDVSIDLESVKSVTTPIASSIKYKNIEISVELSKYQIVERNVRSTSKIKILKYFLNYFRVLKYTPIYKIGINFNSTIFKVEQNTLDLLNNGKSLREFFGTDDLTYLNKVKISQTDINEVLWNLFYTVKENYQITISLTLNNGDLVINQNFEFSDIESNKNIYYRIFRKYPTLEKKNSKFLQYLMGGN